MRYVSSAPASARTLRRVLAVSTLACLWLVQPAAADRIRNPVAVFSGLDKITGRIIAFEVSVNETVQFGALQITPRVCWSRPATEAPLTDAFVEVDEVTVSNEYRRIFSGWMFAASPGLNAVEHAVYDVWLTDCKGGTEVIAEPREPEPEPPPADNRRPPARSDTPPAPGGRIDVAPQQGVPVQPQQPSRQFFPTNRPQQRVPAGQDPAGSSNR